MSDQQILRRARLDFSRREMARALGIFGAVLLIYLATIVAILAAPLLFSLVLVPICGVMVVMLFVVGHDACHQSLTATARLNHIIGRIAFLPSLHVYSLWEHEHNHRHHRYNNIRHMDYAWIPLDTEEYAALSTAGKAWYRFCRSPFGVPFYYLITIWAQRKIIPRSSMLGTITGQHVVDTLVMWIGVIVWSGVIAIVGGWFGKGLLTSITLGVVLPFLIFSALISFAIYLHHTHYLVPWYRNQEEWKRDNGTVRGTVHVEFPWIVQKLFLDIMEHTAHHYAPGVPLYHLADMQKAMPQPAAFAWKWSFRGYFRICERCKLYDFEQGRWMKLDGKYTSGALRLTDAATTAGK